MTKKEELIQGIEQEIERLEIEATKHYPGTYEYQMIWMDIRMAGFSLSRARKNESGAGRPRRG